jgi:hypothetical protein
MQEPGKDIRIFLYRFPIYKEKTCDNNKKNQPEDNRYGQTPGFTLTAPGFFPRPAVSFFTCIFSYCHGSMIRQSRLRVNVFDPPGAAWHYNTAHCRRIRSALQ